MKKLLLMIATIALMTACGGNGNSTSKSGSEGSAASDVPKTCTIEYTYGSNGGSNWECFDVFGNNDNFKVDLEVKNEGDKVLVSFPFEVKVKGTELKRGLKEGYIEYCVDNSSEKGKIEFKLADPDKTDYDAEFKKLKAGDTFKATFVGEITKDMLKKVNNTKGTMTLAL